MLTSMKVSFHKFSIYLLPKSTTTKNFKQKNMEFICPTCQITFMSIEDLDAHTYVSSNCEHLLGGIPISTNYDEMTAMDSDAATTTNEDNHLDLSYTNLDTFLNDIINMRLKPSVSIDSLLFKDFAEENLLNKSAYSSHINKNDIGNT